MRESINMKMIDGRTYLATESRSRKRLLPPTPGIYIWTLQLNRALDGIATGDEVIERFVKPFDQVRSERYEVGTAGLFKEVRVFDKPPLLTAKSAERMAALMGAGHADFSWIAALATLFQRPLYVGKALNFRNRIPDHFANKTTFSEQILAMKIPMSDLAVTLFSLDWSGDHPGDDVQAGQVVADEDEDDENQAGSAGDPADPSNADEEEFVPPERADLDRYIRLAESLLIRQLQPIFNRQVE